MGWAARANPIATLPTKDRWLRRIAGKVRNEAQLNAALARVPALQREPLRAALRPLLSFALSSPLAITPREFVSVRKALDSERRRPHP